MFFCNDGACDASIVLYLCDFNEIVKTLYHFLGKNNNHLYLLAAKSSVRPYTTNHY